MQEEGNVTGVQTWGRNLQSLYDLLLLFFLSLFSKSMVTCLFSFIHYLISRPAEDALICSQNAFNNFVT